MIQIYSENITVAENAVFPLESVGLKIGCSASVVGSTITLNADGVYKFDVDAALEPQTVGIVAVQMLKDGAELAQANSYFTGTIGNTGTLSFCTLIKCGSAPANITLLNESAGAVTGRINVVVTKVR